MRILRNKQAPAFPRSSLLRTSSRIRLRHFCFRFLSSRRLSHELLPDNTKRQFYPLFNFLLENGKFLQSLFFFKKLIHLKPSPYPYLHVLPSLFNPCSSFPQSYAGFGIHGYLIKCGFHSWADVANSLMLMYVKLTLTQEAFQVLEELPARDGDLYNSLICSFGVNGFHEEVVMVFEKMLELKLCPQLDSVIHVIRACGEMRTMEKGKLVQDFVTANCLDLHIPVANSLIMLFIKMGRLDLARQVFDGMRHRDLVSWNSMITGYSRGGNWVESFNLFLTMKEASPLVPNQVTFLGLLLACGQSRNDYLGESIHGHLVRSGLLSELHLGTAVLDMYAKCQRVECARNTFDELPEKSLISWNSMIGGYSQNGYDWKAVNLFKLLTSDTKLKPDRVTFANAIPSYARFGDVGIIRSVHALIIKKCLDIVEDVVLCTSLLDAYGKCLDLKAVEALFSSIRKPNTAAWNAIIAAYYQNSLAGKGLILFCEMLRKKLLPDTITMVMLFQLCGALDSAMQGNIAHAFCFLKGFSLHLTVANAMMGMYMKFGCMHSSELLFSLLPFRNIVSWNIMLSGYVKLGLFSISVKMFYQMQLENHYKPDSVTMICFIQASAAQLGGKGAEIGHGFVVKLGFESETLVANSLIDSYAKSGLICNARALFSHMGQLRDQSSWNVMISGCGMNGQGEEACNLFSRMEEDGYEPNYITFTSLLSSCSHSGLIDEGCRYLKVMLMKYKISPSLEHLTCIIDLFARAGRLEEAYELIKHDNLSNCDAVWAALLSASKMNMNMGLGELSGGRLFRLAPSDPRYHTLLSNLYASGERWEEATKIREMFKAGNLMKKPGLSMVKV